MKIHEYIKPYFTSDELSACCNDSNAPAGSANPERSNLFVTGLGKLLIINTGGSSAGEGGMGSGGGSEKGAGIQDPGSGSTQQDNSSNSDTTDEEWDPLKPKEEKEKGK